MKKYLIALVLCVLALKASAQVFTAEQIERYAKDKYGDNWTEAAGNLSKEVALDNKNRLNYQEVIACAGQSKAEIFKKAIEWFNRAFKSKDTHGVIREQNAEQGHSCIFRTFFHIGLPPVVSISASASFPKILLRF